MSTDSNSESFPGIPENDPPPSAETLAIIHQNFQRQQSLLYGIVGGAAAALIGALLWAVITVGTGYQIGYMALGVGLLVGLSVRILGAGIDTQFGIVGAFFALLGCALGNLFSQIGFIANAEGSTYLETLGFLNLTNIVIIYRESFTPIDILFYGIAGYEGYKFAFRSITDEDIKAAGQDRFSEAPFEKLRIPAAFLLFITVGFCTWYFVKASSFKKTYYYESGAKNYEGTITHGLPDGEWNYYYENGKLESKGYFDDGKLDSVWENYSDEGTLLRSMRYKQGIKHGLATEYYPNGTVLSSGTYKLGRQIGVWKFYYDNEKLKQQGTFINDLAEGDWEQFYEDGSPLAKGSYRKNIAVGKWTYWNQKGVKTLEADFGDGTPQKIINTWDDEGNPGVVNGNGIHNTLHQNGQLSETGKIVNGERSGIWKKFYPDGKIQEEGEYKTGQYYLTSSFAPTGEPEVQHGTGEYQLHFSNGTIQQRGRIENGLKTGPWLQFYPGDTTLLEECEYLNGKQNGVIRIYFDGSTVQAEGEMIDDERNGTWNWYYPTGDLESTVRYVKGQKEGKQTFYNEQGDMIRWEEWQDGEMIDSQPGKY